MNAVADVERAELVDAVGQHPDLAGEQQEQLIASVGMDMQCGAEHTGRHAGDGHVGDRIDPRRARLAVDRRQLAKELPGTDLAQQDLPARHRLDLHADRAGHHEEDVVAGVLIVDDPGVVGRSTPGALRIKTADGRGIERPEQRHLRQGLGLPAHAPVRA
jgi:hypothetical protein